MKNNIVVFGGTFNPLSKAHGDILKLVGKKIDASKLILLPTDCSFLKEWKNFDSSSILSTSLRLEILEEFKKHNKNVEISKIEIEKITSKTYLSLKYLQNEYKDYNLYFIVGSEKLNELERWYEIDNLLKEFKIVVVRRNNSNLDLLIKNNKLIEKYKDSFIFYNSKKYYQDISSTKIRELIKENKFEELNEYTYNYVIKILKKGVSYEI